MLQRNRLKNPLLIRMRLLRFGPQHSHALTNVCFSGESGHRPDIEMSR